MFFLIIYSSIIDLIAYIPQICQILKTKSAKDFNRGAWFAWSSTSLADFIYYIYNGDIVLILSGTVTLICNSFIFILSVIYREKKGEKVGASDEKESSSI